MSEPSEYTSNITVDNNLEVSSIQPIQEDNCRPTVNKLFLKFVEPTSRSFPLEVPLFVDIKSMFDNLPDKNPVITLLDDNPVIDLSDNQQNDFFTYIQNGITFQIKQGKCNSKDENADEETTRVCPYRVIWLNDNGINQLNPAKFSIAVPDTEVFNLPPLPGFNGTRAIYPFEAVIVTPITVTILGTKTYMKDGQIDQSAKYKYVFTIPFAAKRTYAFIRERIDLDNTSVTGLLSQGGGKFVEYTNGLAYTVDEKWLEDARSKATGEKKGGIKPPILAKPPQHKSISEQLLGEINFNDFVGIVYNDPKHAENAEKFSENLQKQIQKIIDSFLVYGPFRGYNETRDSKTAEHDVSPLETEDSPIIRDVIEQTAKDTDDNKRAVEGNCLSPNNCEYYLYSIDPNSDISISEGETYISTIEFGTGKDSTNRIKFVYQNVTEDLTDAAQQYLIDKARWLIFFDENNEQDQKLLSDIANILGNLSLTAQDKIALIKKLSKLKSGTNLERIFFDISISSKPFDFDMKDFQKYLDEHTKESSWQWEENL